MKDAGSETSGWGERLLSAGSLAVYAALVFDRLTEFPLYFFCDEAAAGVDARAILGSGADVFGERWPVFFRGLGDYALSLTVYAETPFVYLLGLDEFSVRLTTALWSVLGVASVYALLRGPLRAESAWLAFAVFAVSPVWFLHARTGFEYVPAASSLIAFSLFYLLALSRSPAYAIPAAVAAAATFYAYTAARGWIVVALLLLALVNLRDHVRHWRATVAGGAVLAVLLFPAAAAWWRNPAAVTKRLESLHFAELRAKPIAVEARILGTNYASAMSPAFWFTWSGTQNDGPMERHVVPHLSQLPVWTAPFALLGLGITVLGFRRLENRTLLALFAASPVAGSVVGFNNARGLAVGVWLLVFALRGADAVLRRLARLRLVGVVATGIAAGALCAYASWFRVHVHEVAPRSYSDYGFYGVQMGAPEVFRWLERNHGPYPRVRVSHAAFNAGEVFRRFYLDGAAAAKTEVFDLSSLCELPATYPSDALYVARVDAFAELVETGCPLAKDTVEVLRDPTGKPAIEFARLARAAGFASWLAAEEAKQSEVLVSELRVNGQRIEIEHPRLDIGDAGALVDGDPASIARSAAINPARFAVRLPETTLRRVSIRLANTGVAEVRVSSSSRDGRLDWGLRRFSRDQGDSPLLRFERPNPAANVTRLELEVRLLDADRYGHVHVAEIGWE